MAFLTAPGVPTVPNSVALLQAGQALGRRAGEWGGGEASLWGRVSVGSNPILPLLLACGLRPHPITLLTSSVPLIAPLGNPKHREMGETLPEEPGECRTLFWGLKADWSPQEVACVSSA